MTTREMAVLALSGWERDRVPVEEVAQWVQVFSSEGSLDASGMWAVSLVMLALHWEVSAVYARQQAEWWFEPGREIGYGLRGIKMAGNQLLAACDDWKTVEQWAGASVEGFAGSAWAGWIHARQEQLMQAFAGLVAELHFWFVTRGAEVPEEVVAWVREQEQRLAVGGVAQKRPGSYSE